MPCGHWTRPAFRIPTSPGLLSFSLLRCYTLLHCCQFLACPAGLIPCLDATASSASLSNNVRLSSHSSGESGSASDDIFECVDPQRSLQSCGGCSFVRDEDGQIVRAPHEQGSDCTALPGVKGVECVRGRCEISAWLCSLSSCCVCGSAGLMLRSLSVSSFSPLYRSVTCVLTATCKRGFRKTSLGCV